MKKKFNLLKKNMLFWTLIYLIIFVLGWIILYLCNRTYLFWFKEVSFLIITIGIIVSTIKNIKKSKYDEKEKKLLYITYLSIEAIISFIVLAVITFPYLFNVEKIVMIDGKLYVESSHSVLLSNRINYYDLTNPIFRKNQPRFEKEYDDTLSDSDYLYTTYYDDNGKVIKTKDKDNSSNLNNEQNNENIETLYTQKISENIYYRVRKIDAALAQKIIIIVEKSSDGGKTYSNQLTDKLLTVNDKAKYEFINENIGFINDNGLSGTSGTNRALLVSQDGGKTFERIKLNINSNLIDYIYFEGMPYFENSKLRLEAQLYLTNDPEVLNLISTDNGLTWEKE